MTTIECPFCELPVELELSGAVEIACDACLVHAEIAADPAPVVAVAA